jgi:hypothetical protein
MFIRFRYAGEVLSMILSESGQSDSLVREVGAPEQLVDADFVAQLDADAVELKTPQTMLANVFARRTF